MRERKEREARRQARKAEKEALSKKRKRNPLPNFRNTLGQEAAELKAAYQTYLAEIRRRQNAQHSTGMHEVIDVDADDIVEPLTDIASVMEEEASWTQVFSYESHKTRGNRPDYNTVKFWPYNMPFPGRRRDEAIVAMAGGCVVSCLHCLDGVIQTDSPETRSYRSACSDCPKSAASPSCGMWLTKVLHGSEK